MRGFTMVLVVYSHVCSYCLGNSWMGFNDVFFLFRLPCFFFISGWLFFKADRLWNRDTIKSVVHKKFMVQIVPTVIFLLLLAPPPLFFSRLGALKGGYWFTFALFEFFILYILSARFCRRWGLFLAVVISAAAYCYDVLYSQYFAHMGLLTKVLGFLSFITWRYYLFFFLGTLAKKHFDTFLHWTSRPWVIVLVVLGFFAIAYFFASKENMLEHSPFTVQRSTLIAQHFLVFSIGGILGMTMIFTLFRYLSKAIGGRDSGNPIFSLINHISRCLKFIGTRTLDIYLLHYFFLPRFISHLTLFPTDGRLPVAFHPSPFTTHLSSPFTSHLSQFLIALPIALLVTAVCLAVSYVIRLSPFLAHYLFGVQKK